MTNQVRVPSETAVMVTDLLYLYLLFEASSLLSTRSETFETFSSTFDLCSMHSSIEKICSYQL